MGKAGLSRRSDWIWQKRIANSVAKKKNLLPHEMDSFSLYLEPIGEVSSIDVHQPQRGVALQHWC